MYYQAYRGINLERIRRSRRMSQAELSRRSGISRSYISSIEQGKYVPSAYVICQLCYALQCTPNDLIDYQLN